MPKKVPLIRIGVGRDGQTVYPEIGKPFDFTKEEVADIKKMEASAGVAYLREPMNESLDEGPKETLSLKKGDEKKADEKL